MPPRPPGTPDVDLTFDGASGTINGGVFMTGQYQLVPDQFFTFLEIRDNGTEQGYNTDGTLQQDQRDVHNSTHSILLAEVPIVFGDGSNGTVEGVAYREFRLNLGEAGNAKQYLSLDSLQIWQQEAGNLTNFTAGSGFAGAHTNYLAYNLDAGGDRWIGLKEGANGNGANQTEFTILIPDSFFINDPAHRYVTLYSEFGMQAGWEADSSSEEWGLSHANGGAVSAMTVHKTAAVAGGTANVVGEVISYEITVANVGNTNLTGLTVTDPSVSNLAGVLSGGFNIGDINHDNQLSTGETWQYTASHTVTQDDLNTLGGGDGQIDNTVTADTAQTTPVSATASVVVESGASLDLTKMANVASVNAAGTVITYTITVTNTGNTTLTGLVVTDTQVNIVTPILDLDAPVLGDPLVGQVLDGDYNAGDTNQNGVEDPGETFQYQIVGDENGNGVQDPGEFFLFTNIGDTNQNGQEDPGETFQYYNAGDTNHDGDEDPGETFQFDVSHVATYGSGDTDNDGNLDVGETWTYSVSYTVTQDDIDNGGVVNPALTHDNTAAATTSQSANDEDTVSVSIVQDPRVNVTKSASVADGTANAAGDVINYTIDVSNAGNMTLTSVNVIDPAVSNLTYVSGDTDGDNKLDLTEIWHYTASHTVTQADIDNGGVVNPALAYTNTASVTTAQGGADADANDSDSESVSIVQDPRVNLTKSASVPGGTANAAGEVIAYTINVANAGNMTLTGAAVSDPSVSNLTRVADLVGNNDNILNVGETWQYTADHAVTQDELDAGGTISNTASVTTAQGGADADANDSDTASVTIVQNPQVVLDKTATVPGGTADTVGEVISYAITIQNTGNVTLTNPVVSDPSVGDLAQVLSGGFNAGDLDQDAKLDVGEMWQYTASHTVTQNDLDTNGGGDGFIDNTASVVTDQGASANDSASVTVVAPPPLTYSMTIQKIALGFQDPDNNDLDAGDTLVYQFIVTNTGTGTQTNVQVGDAGPETATVTGGILASLAPGADSGTFWMGTYTITSDDLTDGVDNAAFANSDFGNAVTGNVHTILAGLNELPI